MTDENVLKYSQLTESLKSLKKDRKELERLYKSKRIRYNNYQDFLTEMQYKENRLTEQLQLLKNNLIEKVR